MSGTVTLNIDLGELPDEPEELYRLATVVNIACGGHAGDEASMKRAVALARASGATVAAHPSYPDRANFGRKTISMSSFEVAFQVHEQLCALAAIAGPFAIVKPHGALYHDMASNPDLADMVCAGIRRALGDRVDIVGPPGAAYATIFEGFADRGYDGDKLIARGRPGAVIEDPAHAAKQALALVGRVQTICVHGDNPNAVGVAFAVRDALERAGVLA